MATQHSKAARRTHARPSLLLNHELRKLLGSPLLWVILLGMVVVNAGIAALTTSDLRAPYNLASQVQQSAGHRINATLKQEVASQPASNQRQRLSQLLGEEQDPYQSYEAKRLGRNAVYALQGDKHEQVGAFQRSMDADMEAKYERLGERAQHLASTAAGQDLYAGTATVDAHHELFEVEGRAVLWESIIVTLLIMVVLLGYERQQGVEPVLASTRTGRHLMRWKVLAGLLISLAACCLLNIATTGMFALFLDTRGVWGSSVSSSFNQLTTAFGSEPFITWFDCTVGGYWLANLGLELLAIAGLALLTAAIHTVVSSTMAAAGLSFLIVIAGYFVEFFAASRGAWGLFQVLSLTPGYLILTQGSWFTGMGLQALVPMQETISSLVALGIGAIVLGLGLHYYQKKDLL
ncbi:hypothetical protein KIMH_10210 [Bombiscardovia apis]|uniref:ABC-2 family transporter protein n=1 Tax=Bombiscardovia apis TaxID=2932182 RepID=A0ABN6SJR0_9BIFI|nr:hypothetical protein [Bombiscardovia apis]BDR54910.1 hypothetical protein KIMH_10210 [Bombiscardovia apis]